jgi:hypothetical protein
MLYEMVSHRVPADAESRMKIFKETGKDPYVSVKERIHERGKRKISYSKHLLDLIDYGCELMPKERPKSALKYRSLLIDDSEQADLIDEKVYFKPDIKSKVVKRKRRISDRARGVIVMALIILAIAMAAASYGLWGTY